MDEEELLDLDEIEELNFDNPNDFDCLVDNDEDE